MRSQSNSEHPPARWHFAVLAVVWTTLCVAGCLTPFHTSDLSVTAATAEFRDVLAKPLSSNRRVDFVANVLAFVPIGFFWTATLAYSSLGRVRRYCLGACVLGSCVLLSLAIEYLQIWLPDRTSSASDLFANSGGALIGVSCWFGFGYGATHWLRKYTSTVRPVQPIDWFLRIYLLGFLYDSLSPFDFTIHPIELYKKFMSGSVILVPFENFGIGWGWTEFLMHAATYVPIGALLSVTWTAQERPVRSLERSVFLGGLSACLVECSQLIVLSRVVDATDVIGGTLGAFVGSTLMLLVFARLSWFSPVPAVTGWETRRWLAAAGLGLVTLAAVFWRPLELTAEEVEALKHSVQAQVEPAIANMEDALPTASDVEPMGAIQAGCDENPTRCRMLRITEPGVYSNLLVDGLWLDRTLVKITADGVILRNCEIRNGTRNALTVYSKNVLIESCKIHHVLAGTYKFQSDAHGVTGQPHNLILRNCEIYQISGDAIQFDPARNPWDNVLVENCTFWTAPLDADAAGFHAGERPGENGIDTKQGRDCPRSRMVVRNCVFRGWGDGQISNQAAVNIKENVFVRFENCRFVDNDICFRLRGETRKYPGAHVIVESCRLYRSKLGFRLEDGIDNLAIRRVGFAETVNKRIYIDRNRIGPGYENVGEHSIAPLIDIESRELSGQL